MEIVKFPVVEIYIKSDSHRLNLIHHIEDKHSRPVQKDPQRDHVVNVKQHISHCCLWSVCQVVDRHWLPAAHFNDACKDTKQARVHCLLKSVHLLLLAVKVKSSFNVPALFLLM